MPRAKMNYTLKEMEAGKFTTCRVWRGFRACKGGATLREAMGSGDGYAFQSALADLVNHGWVRKCGRQGRFMIYEALEQQSALAPTEPDKIAKAKMLLTQAASNAAKARRTALVSAMGQCLRDLEKELREIRDMM